ncbi:hypothetical protein ACKVE0_10400 [Acinetobacter albensis]|uniref:Uncharacterized protein n=1 Tax=Acinetobacter albensis TaxID=1673609 RepID=A0ABW9JW44_9GAMM
MSTQIVNCAHHTPVFRKFNLDQFNFIQINSMNLFVILPIGKNLMI